MVISVFHLPNMGGEKITLSISVLLALTFFLNLVSGLTPRNGFLIGLTGFNFNLEVLRLMKIHMFCQRPYDMNHLIQCYEMHETIVHETRLVQ